MSQSRISMRPVTLKRLIEVCSLALKNEVINETLVIHELKTSSERAKELLFEIERMKVIEKKTRGFTANNNARKLIELFEKEDWYGFHDYFVHNYLFYHQFIDLLEAHEKDERGLSINQMIEEASTMRLQLNRTAIEVLQNWCERLGVLQRHLYTKRSYLLARNEPNDLQFKSTFENTYRKLNTSTGLGLRLMYVEIPKLREEVCEILKARRETFDSLFKRLYSKSIGKIELSGAPTITVAKRSPLGIRTIKANMKDDILAPYLDLAKERKGIEIGGKAYYYVALHEK